MNSNPIDIEDEDMEEFEEYEEEFEARQSISSRGSQARPSKNYAVGRSTGVIRNNVNQQEARKTNYQPQENLHDYHEQYEGEENFGEGESESVIEEIVEQQVVEIETDNEQELDNLEENQNQEVNKYLNNINREEYVNRDEYQEYDDEKEASPDPQEQEADHGVDHENYENEQNYHDEREYQEDGHYNEEQQQYEQDDGEGDQDIQGYEQDNNYNQMADNQYMMENSPIAENPLEEELTGSPQVYEAPRAVNPKYRKKYQGINPNDKSHLIWERERLERKRIEREMNRAHLWTKQFTSRDIDWHPNVNPKRAAFAAKDPKRSSLWHFSNSSSVPMLSNSNSVRSTAASAKSERVKFDPKEAQSKGDHRINNVFHQSSYQNFLSGKDGKISTPSSHVSLKKELGRAFMTPIDNRYMNQTSVQEGRNRMFHSSNVF